MSTTAEENPVDPRPVMLARYQPGVHAQWGHLVHAVFYRGPVTAGMLSARCGALLDLGQIETVTPGQGIPCTRCLQLRRAAPTPPAARSGSGSGSGWSAAGGNSGDNPPVATATGYRGLFGWAISLHRDQVWLSLDQQVSALLIPTGPATDAQAILTACGRPAPVLTHPDAPEHQVMLAGEPTGTPLPWAPPVHTVIEMLALPPTITARGPLTWVHLPEANSARLCRESDLFAAVRTALGGPPPTR